MFSVRIHGRGGQGVVTAAELLSIAAHAAGRYAQAFPSFGSERMGAPVVSFCRVSDGPIRLREPVTHPDGLIVQDPTLLPLPEVFAGLAPHAYVLLNSRHDAAEIELPPAVERSQLAVLPATQLALTHLGRPVPNIALLGGFAALTGLVPIGAVLDAIRGRFHGPVADGNVAAAQAAYDRVLQQRTELTDA
jgi:pyruvate ferredoxin oxidoreductase gamma subunit